MNNRTKLKWQCKEGHIWETRPRDIKKGHWCPICGAKISAEAMAKKKLTIEEMQRIANQRRGRCLSNQYIDVDTKLKWQCKEGHIWEAIPYSIKIGGWCPKCSDGISERICRKIFESIFNERFPKRKPAWLSTPQGNKMELDGYCNKLGVAFEYQGIQHYKDIPIFHEKRSFDRQKAYDELKKKKCQENNVILIEIPYSVDYEKMPECILKECKKRNIEIPEITKSLDYRLMNIYSPEKLKEMKEIAENRGGHCLSSDYINSQTSLKWKCKEGHVWEAMPGLVKKGTWCPICGIKTRANKRRLPIDEMQRMARERGGQCISSQYVDGYTKLKWQCKEGHFWEATPSKIKCGQWCPYCAHCVRLSMEEMQKLAKSRGGVCLSTEYVNNRINLKWKCKEGHVWGASAGNIKAGKWCPICGIKKTADKKRLTIEKMQEFANIKGGVCLSNQYIDAHTKLKWKCKEGHVWDAIPNSVQRGSWCPICARNRKRNVAH